jgi:type I restriction enzyme M protein
VTISLKDYEQGANYAQYEHARFFVTHNHRETKYWKVDDTRRMPNYDEIANIPHADATEREIVELLARLKVFKEDEFAKLLHECHNVIRNREKLDPAAAFDEIAKILFVKVWVERDLRQKKQRENLFTVKWLDTQAGTNPLNWLFKQTKAAYADDRIFEADEEIRLKLATGRDIVKLLERYNLSDTSEDIKGIAFERFLGRTFRGDIGQFFTPRTIVEFMIRMVEPKEGDVICDPASGSGGFLIRFFEIVRQQILADADRQYQAYKTDIERDKKTPLDRKAALLREKFDAIQATLDHDRPGSRLWTLANRCIFGADANDRMARTSKMNMIMHGDGHGGVHHHDGFLNVNGIFEGRFDIVLTNPPFGANVEPTDVVHESDATVSREVEKRYTEEYGDLYTEALARVAAAKGDPIASLFELPKGSGNEKERDKRVKSAKIKTEILFIERCLSLLKPGGRLGIVLPEGVFNNPSLAYVREFCENRAFIRAVVSLPQETFFSSGAGVKASLLFLQKFTVQEQVDFDARQAEASRDVKTRYADAIAEETARLETAIAAAKATRDVDQRKALQKELADFHKRMAETITGETRALLKKRFPYPIFLYAAEKVGITATGDEDQNELCRYPKDNSPVAVPKTCLELYTEFLRNQAANGKHVRVVSWSSFERWISPRSLIAAQDLPLGWTLVRVREVVQQIQNRVKVEPAKEYRMAGVKWYGEGVFHRETVQGASMSATSVSPLVVDALIYNRLFAWKASFAVVPKELNGCCVSNEFPQFKVESRRVLPVYLYLFFTLDSTLRSVNVASVGSSAVSRNRFKEDEFLSFELPLPPLAVQKAIVERWCQSQDAIIAAKRKAERIAHEIKTEMENTLPK